MCLHGVLLLPVGLHLQSLVDLVVIIDHGQFLFFIVLADVCLGNVLFVDYVVDLIGVALLDLDADDEVVLVWLVFDAGVEESALVEERQELDGYITVDFCLLPARSALKLQQLNRPILLQSGLLLLLVLFLVLVLTGKGPHHYLIKHVLQDLIPILLCDRYSEVPCLLLKIVVDADVVYSAVAVEVADDLALDRITLVYIFLWDLSIGQLLAEILIHGLNMSPEAI